MTLDCTGILCGCYMLNFTEAVMYILYDPKGSYTDGVSHCENEGLIYSTLDSGLLTQLPDIVQEVAILGSLVDNVWIGLTKEDESKPWKWYDGTDVDYTWFPWGPGQPSLTAYPACVRFDKFDYLWYTEDCASTNYYLCMEDWTTETASNVTEVGYTEPTASTVQLSSTETTQPTEHGSTVQLSSTETTQPTGQGSSQSAEWVETEQQTTPEKENWQNTTIEVEHEVEHTTELTGTVNQSHVTNGSINEIIFVPFNMMLKSLIIDKTSTFKYRYRFKSMEDNRPMAMGIGLTASLVLLLIILTIGILDLSSIIRDLKMLRNNVQSFMGRHSNV